MPVESEDKRMGGRLWPGLLQLESMSLATSRPGRTAWCASSRAVVRAVVAMVNTPFTSRDLTETGAHAHARPDWAGEVKEQER